MQKLAVLIFIALIVGSCSSTQKAVVIDQSVNIHSEGMKLIHPESFPLNAATTQGVVRVMKGNQLSGSGIFISDNGLLLTNYSNAIQYFADASSSANSAFSEGFIADNMSQEIALTGLPLLIEVEQIDVTDIIQQDVTDASSNYEISILTQQAKNKLIEETRAKDPTLYVEIKDLFSRNRQILTTSQIITDVRLVFAPEVHVEVSDFADSDLISDSIADEYVLLRAYTNPAGETAPFASTNIPFTPKFSFTIPPDLQSISEDTLFALGYPNRTYRDQSSRAFEFYNTRTNPYILASYKIFQNSRDSFAKNDFDFAKSSLSDRVSTAQSVSFYEAVQNGFKESSLVELKKADEQDFMNWVHEDSIRNASYGGIYWYIDDAYEIADKTGDIFFATTYIENLYKIDDIVRLFKPYMDAVELGKSHEELANDRVELINYQKLLLNDIDIPAELSLFKQFLLILKSVPENQQPLILFDLFQGEQQEHLVELISTFVDNNGASSFLFNPEMMEETLVSESFYSDSLFLIVEEISTTLETARANFVKHYSYLFPAQQLLSKGYLQMENDLAPDSDGGSLRFNIGSFDRGKYFDERTFYSTIDFSGKAPGSAILNSSGELIGMITDEINLSILSNYMFSSEFSFTKNLSVPAVIMDVTATGKASNILLEINKR